MTLNTRVEESILDHRARRERASRDHPSRTDDSIASGGPEFGCCVVGTR